MRVGASLVGLVLKFWLATAFASVFLFALYFLGMAALSLFLGTADQEPFIYNTF